MSGREGGRVKNRAPAQIQITAEQLLREAADFQEQSFSKPRQRVEDLEELTEYRSRKRQEFEEQIRRTRSNLSAWTKYANWEASQNEFPRSRSVFERALDVDPTSIKIWMSYTEMELKARNVQHARNLYDRAVTLLPRLNQLWYKYVYLEELLGNIAGARQVFERWMKWEPDEKAWSAFIGMEVRYEEWDRASALWQRAVECHPTPRQFVKYAKFEEERQNLERAREIFAMAFEFFGQNEEGINTSQSVYVAMAKMEVRAGEIDRARVVYKFALERLPRAMSANLYASFTTFEKQHGTRNTIEATVLGKRRLQYESEIKDAPVGDYDTWFEYIRLEEDAFKNQVDLDREEAVKRVRDIYERAVSVVPPTAGVDVQGGEARYWRRYIFLWLEYALWEETATKDLDRAREIYQTAVNLVPHKRFTFAKLWRLYAEFEIRQLNIDAARKIMGRAIGMCPKPRIFKDYIDLEMKLKEFNRCRIIYQKWIQFEPTNPTAWIKFTELEAALQEDERVRVIFDLAISQPAIDMPELVWKAWIDYETGEEEYDRARDLYERLLRRTSHVKVWVTFGQFEVTSAIAMGDALLGIDDDDEDEEKPQVEVSDEVKAEVASIKEAGLERSRAVFKRGYDDLKSKELKEERVVLLEAWKAIEIEHGTSGSLDKVEAMMPRVVKKMRKMDGDSSRMEEYYDMVFADDETTNNPASRKFLELAHAWKQKAALEESSEEEESDEDSE